MFLPLCKGHFRPKNACGCNGGRAGSKLGVGGVLLSSRWPTVQITCFFHLILSHGRCRFQVILFSTRWFEKESSYFDKFAGGNILEKAQFFKVLERKIFSKTGPWNNKILWEFLVEDPTKLEHKVSILGKNAFLGNFCLNLV